MGKLRSWWQLTRKPLVVIGCIAALVVVALIFLEVRLYGTGFAGKTLWDWFNLLGVLAIPVVVGFGAVWFTTRQGKVANAENKDNQREAALQAYIDKISELLLHEHLGESLGNPQVETIARARTATVLRILDPVRRGSLIRFLSQAGILVKCTEKEKAMAGLDLHGADLSQLNLRSTNLTYANLSGAYLSESDLSEAFLIGADLSGASLWMADLSGADLTGANLRGTTLIGANLNKARLFDANLRGAHLNSADLSGADLSETDLHGTILSEANLRNTKVTQEQLDKAKTLNGATMPDG